MDVTFFSSIPILVVNLSKVRVSVCHFMRQVSLSDYRDAIYRNARIALHAKPRNAANITAFFQGENVTPCCFATAIIT